MKAADVKFFLAPQGVARAPKAQAPRGVPKYAPRNFKIEHSETPFPAFVPRVS